MIVLYPWSKLILHACVIMLSCFSHVRLFATLLPTVCQAPLSVGFSRQESWSGLPFPAPGDLPDPGIELTSVAAPALAGRFFSLRHLGSPCINLRYNLRIEIYYTVQIINIHWIMFTTFLLLFLFSYLNE